MDKYIKAEDMISLIDIKITKIKEDYENGIISQTLLYTMTGLLFNLKENILQ